MLKTSQFILEMRVIKQVMSINLIAVAAECVKYCEAQRTLDIYRNLQPIIPEKMT